MKLNCMYMRCVSLFSLFAFLSLFTCGCCQILGDNSLGENFSLLEGDKTTDRAIVYCTARSWGCCYAGIPVIPSRKNLFVGYYIEIAKYDSRWIVAKSYDKNKNPGFWIIDKNVKINLKNCDKIDCDSTLQSHVMGPYNLADFNKKVDILKILLVLE